MSKMSILYVNIRWINIVLLGKYNFYYTIKMKWRRQITTFTHPYTVMLFNSVYFIFISRPVVDYEWIGLSVKIAEGPAVSFYTALCNVIFDISSKSSDSLWCERFASTTDSTEKSTTSSAPPCRFQPL